MNDCNVTLIFISEGGNIEGHFELIIKLEDLMAHSLFYSIFVTKIISL
jgi:hypothetical protein